MTPDGCNTGGEAVRPVEEQNSRSTHPHPEQIDPRDWCIRCGVHTATEGVNVERRQSICPVCRDEDRRSADRVRQHSTDRGQTGADVNDPHTATRAALDRQGAPNQGCSFAAARIRYRFGIVNPPDEPLIVRGVD